MFEDLVSIVIPCYNQAHFLSEAIESVRSQSYRLFEIVVVDDGSTDNSFDVASRYTDVHCIRQENRGLSATRNRGARESKGDYLVFLDADDRLLSNSLKVGLTYLKDLPEVALVAGHCQHIARDGTSLPTPPQREVETDHYIEMLRDNFIWPPAAAIFRRSSFESVGGFNLRLSGLADYDIYLRIAAQFPIHFHDQIVAEYRQHDTNMSSNCEMMLKESVLTLKFQRDYAKRKPKGYVAYKTGLRESQRFYGEPVCANTQGMIRAHAWRQVFSGLWTLMRYYPVGLLRFLFPGLYCVFFGMKDQILNFTGRMTHLMLGRSFGFITANPRVIHLTDGLKGAEISLSWKSLRTSLVEVHVDSPDGPVLSRTGPSGCTKTGPWVRDGTIFYLQDASAGSSPTASNTIAIVTVNVITN